MSVFKLIPVLLFAHACSQKCNSLYDLQEGCDWDFGSILDVVKDVKSVIHCAALCSGNNDCASVKYDPAKNHCETNLEIYEFLHNDCLDKLQYALLTNISCRTFIGDDCEMSDECAVTNSDCRQGVCLCSAGYSYNPADGSCVPYCDIYGSTFTPDVGKLLSGHNGRIIDFTDEIKCLTNCEQEKGFTCRTAEFSHMDNTCFLSNMTALTAPEDYMALKSYTLYQRNCLTSDNLDL